jgi:putative ABC transport system permease protein
MHSLEALARAIRALSRRPVFSLLNLTLLTLTAAAVATIFAVVNATLLRPLPYRDPDALFQIDTYEAGPDEKPGRFLAGPTQLGRWRDATRMFAQIEGYSLVVLDLTGDGEPRALRGAAVSGGLFELLGSVPAAGRSFRRDEETPMSGVVILGHEVAEQRFGDIAAAIGKHVNLDGQTRTVIGVMPRGYSLLFQGGDVWIPMDLTGAEQANARIRNTVAYGRLRPGVTPQQAQADLEVMMRQLSTEYPGAFRVSHMQVDPIREALFGPSTTGTYILVGALLLVLLIAGTNIGNLALADVVARRNITMTRLALGASRGSVIRLRLAEILVFTIVSALAGVALGYGTLTLLISIDPTPFLALGSDWIDARVVAVAFAATAFVAFGATLPAALREAGVDIGAIASAATKSASGRHDHRIRQGLVIAQVAITVVLLCGAALLGRDFARLMSQRPGFEEDGVLVVTLNVSPRIFTTRERRAQYVDDLVRGVRGVPGVEAVSTIQTRFVLNEAISTTVQIDGKAIDPNNPTRTQNRHVMPDIFRVLRTRVRQGRGIDSTDRADAPLVAVVSASFAETHWPGENPIGKRIRRGTTPTPGPWMEVVGVVDDMMDAGIGVSNGPTMYLSYLQQNTPSARVTIVARTRGNPAALGRSVRDAIWAANPSQAIDDVTPLATLMGRTAAQPRFQAFVVAVFGGSSLLLVLAGIYALTLFSILGRRRELGVRAALGASPGEIVVFAMRGSLLPVIAGVATGGLVAIPIIRLMQRVVNAQLGFSDIPLLGAVVVLLPVAAAAAALIPARRAGKISPSIALQA